ncbi:MAG TPA: hypothetical protein VNR61_02995 [Niallia sp.]|nr:hypothetical protein [Niallia sp.]
MSSIFLNSKARYSTSGVTHISYHNPYMVAWWSAVFPGFGHYILNQYLRATLLSLLEVIINTGANLNEAMVYSFCGEIELAKATLNLDWMLGYILIYLVTIADSYRGAVQLNTLSKLAEPTIPSFEIFPAEVSYLSKKNPLISALHSFLFPGLGQLYNQRIFLAFYSIFWWWVYILLSHAHMAIVLLITGDFESSLRILHPHWLSFMPSVLGGSVYFAFVTCRDHNKLFDESQKDRLSKRYSGSKLRL